ncbi:MAG: putative assembly protein [Inoviridae sp.]|nr:MAG: putative assembly protein [Inoviridae sp.]
MKNIAFFLLFFLLVSVNTTAQANTLAGGSGWRVASTVANGIGVTVNGAKDVLINGAKKTVTGVANVTPTAGQVGKFMGKNLSAAAVVGAMDLLLDGVDYVMDPANNTVTYKTKPSDAFLNYKGFHNTYGTGSYANPQASCSSLSKSWPGGIVVSLKFSSGGNGSEYIFFKCVFYSPQNSRNITTDVIGIYDPSVVPKQQETKSIPLVNLGSQVLDQAETEVKTGNPAVPIATPVTQAAAAAVVGEAETDDTKARPIATELDKNTSYPSDTDIEGEITTPEVVDPVTGEVVKPAETSSIAMQFPKACEWFPQLCLFIDWMQKPQELDEPDLPTKEIEKKEIDEELIKISSSSCPAPIDVNIPLPVFNTTYTDSISVSEYCPKIEKLAPVLQLLAFVLAIMIIKDI